MIPLGIAGQVMSGVPQDVPVETGSSQGIPDFLALFERVLGIGAAARVADGAVPEGLISMSEATVGEDAQTGRQESSGVSDGKEQPERGVDSAVAILIASLSPPMRETGSEAPPGLDRVVDLAPPVETSPQAAALPQLVPTQGPRPTLPPADAAISDLLAIEPPPDSPATIPVEIGTFLKPQALSQGAAGVPVMVTGPVQSPQGLRVTTQLGNAVTNDARLVEQSAKARRLDPEANRIEPLEPSPGLDRVVDLAPPVMAAAPPVRITLPVAAPSPAIPPQGARLTLEPVVDLQAVEPPPDAPAAIPVEIGTFLTPQAAAITISPLQSEPLEANASAYPKPSLSEETAIPGAAPGPVSLSSSPQPSAGSQRVEPPVRVPQSLLSSQGSRPTREPAAARPTLLMPLTNNEQSGISDQRSASGRDRIPVGSATEVRDGISRSSSGQAAEQVGDLPQMVAPMDDPPRAAVARPEVTGGHSSLSQHSRVPISTVSDPVEVLGSEMLEGVVSPDRVQVGRADGDRAAAYQGSTRIETEQAIQPDRSPSGSEGGNGSPDLSSHLPSDGRQSGADFALAAPPRAEELRLGSAVPPAHAQSLVDQVAEQVAQAARLSLRGEGGHVSLRLHPQALGELSIEVSWKESGIVAAIKTQSHVAGDLLTSDLGRLRTALGEQGIPVSGLDVQVGLDLRHWSFEGNGFRSSSPSGFVPETIDWRGRESTLPLIPAMESDSLIDITV